MVGRLKFYFGCPTSDWHFLNFLHLVTFFWCAHVCYGWFRSKSHRQGVCVFACLCFFFGGGGCVWLMCVCVFVWPEPVGQVLLHQKQVQTMHFRNGGMTHPSHSTFGYTLNCLNHSNSQSIQAFNSLSLCNSFPSRFAMNVFFFVGEWF